jgi:serine/threonine-protein kinase
MSQDTLAELLLDWEEGEEQGRPVPPEELCQRCPEHLVELRRRIGMLRALSPLLEAAPTGECGDVSPNVPGFEILDQIGRGGMGVVYRARDLALDRVVALKMPWPAPLLGPLVRQRFEREARVLAKLRHPHIVPVHAAGLLGVRPYFVMDYVAGGNLAEQKAQFAANPEGAAALVEKVARAVGFAHQHGILHRDLKPSNIFLDERGEPLVGDFGVAALREGRDGSAGPTAGEAPTPTDGLERLTRSGMALGTPAYMAPEQAPFQSAAVGPPADVWALGVILYELLTGRLPALAGEPGAHQGPDRLENVPPGWDRRLANIVGKCLEIDPARRYASADVLAADLARWCGRQRSWRRWRRIRWPALVSAVVLLGILWAAWPRSAEERHRAQLQGPLEQLAQGAAVDLIPEGGSPVSYMVRVGQSFTRVETRQDGSFSVFAPKRALVELLPDPGCARYRLTAEVREDGCHGDAELGIYYNHRRVMSAKGEAHLFGTLSFADLGPRAQGFKNPNGAGRGSQVALNHVYYREPGPPLGPEATYNGPNQFYDPPDALRRPGPWRRLTLEVTPEQVTAAFDDVALPPFARKGVRMWSVVLPSHHAELRNVPLEIDRIGGLGLYVNGCLATFRRFRVEPLAAP